MTVIIGHTIETYLIIGYVSHDYHKYKSWLL